MTAIVSMWSGPRNISTTMMRSFANRQDTKAIDEPFYAHYLAASGADHPYRAKTIAAYPSDFDAVRNWIGASNEKPVLFLKHIAYHIGDDCDLAFVDGWRNFLLIRDPRAMVASFANKFDDVTPIIRSYEIELKILDRMKALGRPCPVVDAADILRAPESVLRALCAALEIPFDRAMLSWPAGARPEDGPWAPHWYDAVRASTGFNAYVEKKTRLSNKLAAVAEAAAPAYRRLSALRITG